MNKTEVAKALTDMLVWSDRLGSDERYEIGRLAKELNKSCRRFNEWELMEDVSLLYLTEALPTDHTEWPDSQLDSFLNEHVSEAYEDYDADGLWRLIEDTSYQFHHMMRERGYV